MKATLVRHGENGARTVLADDVEMAAEEVNDFNRAMVKTLIRFHGKKDKEPGR